MTFHPVGQGAIPGNPMTTLGDMIYENSQPTAARLAGNTSATKNFLTQTGTGTVSAAPAWGTIAVADVPQAQAPNSYAPATALAQTLPIWQVNTGAALTTVGGTLYLFGITCLAGVQVSNITFLIGNTSGTTLTHGWFALVNSALLQVAHTADQTSGSLTTGTEVTKALVAPFTPVTTAQYYIGISVTATAQPSLAGYGTPQAGGIFALHPNAGASSTGLTGPGTDNVTSYIAISASGNPCYGWTS